MSERKMSFLTGFTLEDFFQDLNDVLLGSSGTFTIACLARCLPGFGPDGPGAVAPVGYSLNNSPVLAPEDSGFLIAGSFAGVTLVQWGDGAASQVISADSGLVAGGDSGTTALLHCRFDQAQDTVDMWFNGNFIESFAGAGFVPSPGGTPTAIGTLGAETPGVEFDGELGLAGLAIVDSVLSPQDISDHYNACLESDQMFNTGVFDALWDVREGLPTIDNETTQWVDEVAAAPLDRLTTDDNFAMSVGAHKPRFQ